MAFGAALLASAVAQAALGGALLLRPAALPRLFPVLGALARRRLRGRRATDGAGDSSQPPAAGAAAPPLRLGRGIGAPEALVAGALLGRTLHGRAPPSWAAISEAAHLLGVDAALPAAPPAGGGGDAAPPEAVAALRTLLDDTAAAVVAGGTLATRGLTALNVVGVAATAGVALTAWPVAAAVVGALAASPLARVAAAARLPLLTAAGMHLQAWGAVAVAEGGGVPPTGATPLAEVGCLVAVASTLLELGAVGARRAAGGVAPPHGAAAPTPTAELPPLLFEGDAVDGRAVDHDLEGSIDDLLRLLSRSPEERAHRVPLSLALGVLVPLSVATGTVAVAAASEVLGVVAGGLLWFAAVAAGATLDVPEPPATAIPGHLMAASAAVAAVKAAATSAAAARAHPSVAALTLGGNLWGRLLLHTCAALRWGVGDSVAAKAAYTAGMAAYVGAAAVRRSRPAWQTAATFWALAAAANVASVVEWSPLAAFSSSAVVLWGVLHARRYPLALMEWTRAVLRG